MLRNDDADIDALMGSVVGHNGTPAEFPPEPAPVIPIRPGVKRVEPKRTKVAALATASVDELTGKLSLEIESSEAERAFVDPRTIAVRFSNLKHIARSPLHYLDAVQLDRDDTLAMRIGRGAHAMVLGEPVVKYAGRRAGKGWETFQRDNPGTEILNEREWSIATGIADAIRRHPIAAELVYGDHVVREQTIEWEWLGRRCTSRPDALIAGKATAPIVTDLKTTQCADPAKFMRDAMFRGYNAQLSFYGMAVKHATGREPADLYVAAVESKRPYAVTVLRLDDGARLQGEKLCRLWMERLLTCEASNHWPAYTDAVVAFSVPGDGDPNAAIDVDELADEDAWA